MANILKRETGLATSSGAVIYTVPANTRITIIGCRLSNTGAAATRKIFVEAANTAISGRDLPLPIGSAIDILVGSKIVMEAGDTLVAYTDAGVDVAVYVSFLEQTED